MFEINDTIMYGSSGVCKIVDIQPKKFNGENIMYYVIKPIDKDDSTIYCPVNGKARIRKLLSAEEVNELIKTAHNSDGIWEDNDRLRHEKFSDIIKSGDRRNMIMLINAIYASRDKKSTLGKKLHSDDERFLKDAENIIYGEFATALNIRRDEVAKLIKGTAKAAAAD